MCGVDKRVAHYPVLMIAQKDVNIPYYSLPQGYHFVAYEPMYKSQWVRLHVALGHLKSIAYGTQYFAHTYEMYPEALSKQMILVVDTYGTLVGSSSIWRGNHFGVEKLRVHWLGVHHKHQRKGIAKAALSRCMQLHKDMKTNDVLYLTTQTNSYKAIRMYKTFGFEPYMKEMPINFQGNRDTFCKDNEIAWNIINEKIKA